MSMRRSLFSTSSGDGSYQQLRQVLHQLVQARDCQDAAFPGLVFSVYLAILQEDESPLWRRFVKNEEEALAQALIKLFKCDLISESLLWQSIQRWFFVTDSIPISLLDHLRATLPAQEHELIDDLREYIVRRNALDESESQSQSKQQEAGMAEEQDVSLMRISLDRALETFSEDKLLLLMQSSRDLSEHDVRRLVNRLQTDKALEYAEKLCERRWPNVVKDVVERRQEVQAREQAYLQALFESAFAESQEQTIGQTKQAQAPSSSRQQAERNPFDYDHEK
ncbi:MAG: hypothetical protein QXS54_11045, partial [Candidatus Methanomethylicaceae archaeon]